MTRAFGPLKSRLSSRTPARIDEPGAIETAVAAILAPGEEGLEALFIRRAERAGDPWSGHIGLPGGRRETEDADRLDTALRETEEEVGVSLPRESLLGPLDDLHPRTPSLPPVVISPFVFGLERRPATRLSDEVAGVLWVPLSRLTLCEATAEVPIKGRLTPVPCFRVPDAVIWGLTYRIMRSLLPLLPR